MARQRRYSENRPGRHDVIYSSCLIHIYDGIIGADAYLAVHCARMQANDFIDHRIQVPKSVELMEGWNWTSITYHLVELVLHLL
jgi:hypothetical protein